MHLNVYLLLQLFLFRLVNTSFTDKFLIYDREALSSIFFNYPATEKIIFYTKEEEH